MIKVEVKSGQEVIETVTAELARLGVADAAIVSVIGAVDEYCISNMPRDDATKDLLTEFSEPSELSGTGEVTDGRVHIHCVLGREDNSTLSGHLHWAKPREWFVHVYVAPLQ